MTKRRIIVVIIFLLLNAGLIIAQSYSANIRKLSIENGLSNRYIRSIFHDSRGFAWMGTDYGLNRYDGYNFKLITKEKEGLFGNVIADIYEDKDTCLWVTFLDAEDRPLEKINIINLHTLEVQSFEEKFVEAFPIEEYEIFEIYQVAPQTLFIVTKSKKVFKYMGNGVCEQLFELPYPSHTVNNILLCEDAFWVVGAGYLLEYDVTGKFREEELTPFKSILDVHCVNNELVGYAQYLQNDSLFTFSKKINEELRYGAPDLLTNNLKTLKNRSWVRQAPNGLIWYNEEHKKSHLYTAQGELIYDFSEYLRDKTIRHEVTGIVFGSNNTLWIYTSNGVFILTIEPNRFHAYLNKDEFVPSSKGYIARGMVEDDYGALYINTHKGRHKLDLATGNSIEFDSTEKRTTWHEWDAIRDSKGCFWFCGDRNLVQCYDPVKKVLKEFPTKHGLPDESEDYQDKNLKLYEDSYGRMWMGTRNGIYYLDTTSQAFIKFNAYGFCEKLNTSVVYDIVEDTEDKILWVGTASGLYKYDYELGRFTYRYGQDQEKPLDLPHNYIFTIHKDKDWLWLGTNGGGMIMWHPKTGEHKQFTIATGLSDNVIYGILEDDNDNLWLSSNYGLMRFNKKSKWSNIYLPKDGLTAGEFNKISAYKSPSGRFYFGGVNGVVAFYPNDFQEEGESQIPLHILSYECFAGDVKEFEDRTEELIRTKEIVLEPDDHLFKLSFSLLDYRNPIQNRYSYTIDNGSEQKQTWQFTYENEIRINRLPYGKYTLIIHGQDKDGQWSNYELKIPIYVKAPFYKTTSFFVMIAILFVLIVSAIARMSIMNSQKNKKYLEQEIASRTQKLLEREQDLLKAKEEAEKSSHAKAEFLSIMSHEIRTPMNAVVNLTNYLLEDNPAERQVENLNILKFSANNLLAIINDVLDFNKIESGKVEFESINFDLLNLMESIHYGMAVNAKEKNIDFFLETDIELSQMLIGDPNRLTQILNNLISNAIKFTEVGYVKLKIIILEETDADIILKFEVEDTGIGISDDEKTYIFNMFTQAASDTTRKYGGTGLGLAIIQRLLQLQHSDIDLKSIVGKGSVFSFILKFGKGTPLVHKNALGDPQKDPSNDLEGMRVLVVEDNTVNVLVVKKFLEKWKVDFMHASDGVEAIEKVQKHVFDLILMDIHMPNMDGYEATESIRAFEGNYYKSVPIIALTASALMDNKERIYNAGMNDIVVKPFKPAELYKILVKYLVKT